ncbi:hypothetical protein LINGRAHAP2_LOCUS35337, partial [Linum grandiflorum]
PGGDDTPAPEVPALEAGASTLEVGGSVPLTTRILTSRNKHCSRFIAPRLVAIIILNIIYIDVLYKKISCYSLYF